MCIKRDAKSLKQEALNKLRRRAKKAKNVAFFFFQTKTCHVLESVNIAC